MNKAYTIELEKPFEFVPYEVFSNDNVKFMIFLEDNKYSKIDTRVHVNVMSGNIYQTDEVSRLSLLESTDIFFKNLIRDEQGNETEIDYTPKFKYKVI